MGDVKCPYCETEQEINHDDGYGFEDGVEFTQECTNCRKKFKFTTEISYDYEVFCDGEHDMQQSPILEHNDLWSCSKCDFYEVRRE